MAFDLKALPQGQPITDANGIPTLQFSVYFQQLIETIEAQEANQDALLTQILAVQAEAAAAQAAADTAQTTATTVQRDDAISDSWTVPGTTLTASDAGANATIAIAAHERRYNDGTVVSISATSLTALAYSTKYFVYYDDATRSDTTPTFVATTTATTAVPNTASGRHFVGEVITPAAAGAPTSGGTNPPSGGGTIIRGEVV